jgi:hypothetical protein
MQFWQIINTFHWFARSPTNLVADAAKGIELLVSHGESD